MELSRRSDSNSLQPNRGRHLFCLYIYWSKILLPHGPTNQSFVSEGEKKGLVSLHSTGKLSDCALAWGWHLILQIQQDNESATYFAGTVLGRGQWSPQTLCSATWQPHGILLQLSRSLLALTLWRVASIEGQRINSCHKSHDSAISNRCDVSVSAAGKIQESWDIFLHVSVWGKPVEQLRIRPNIIQWVKRNILYCTVLFIVTFWISR